MKANYFLKKAVFMAVFCIGTLALNANIIYLASDGNDANDGSSPSTAFATLNAAVEASESGDTIVVSGTVYVANVDPFALEHSLNFVGIKNAAFDGGGEYTIMNITPGTEEEATYHFQDITFQNAFRDENGGALNISGVGLSVYFTSCIFQNNATPALIDGNNGGAIFGNGGAALAFYNCKFTKNHAFRGGAIEMNGGEGSLTMQYCSLMQNTVVPAGNNSTGESRGAALAIFANSINLYHTYLARNECKLAKDGTGGGGGAIAHNKDLYMEACSVIDNISSDHGGAIFSMGDNNNITLINTTIAGNSCKNAGGTFFLACSNADMTLLNTTISSNRTTNNAGNGGGIRVMNPIKLHVINSIIEGNKAVQYDEEGVLTSTEWCDFTFNEPAKVLIGDSYVKFTNSIVGPFGDGNFIAGDYESANSQVQTYDIAGDFWVDGKSQISDEPVTGMLHAYYYLKDNDEVTSPAIGLAETSYLSAAGIVDDLMMVERPAPKCNAGAVEATNGRGREPKTPEDPTRINTSFLPSAIVNPSFNAAISIYPNPATEYIQIGIAEQTTENVVVELFSISGQKVRTLFEGQVSASQRIALNDVASGLYLVKITRGESVAAQRLVIK